MRRLSILVLGCGRVGAQIAANAASAGHSVGVIDRQQSSFGRLPVAFAGRTWLGDGMDKDVLEAAGVACSDAVAAVMFGDNSNIVAARIAKETYAVRSVVARIKDPRRAEIYQRLGIPTVAPVTWAAEQVLRRMYGDETWIDWTHPSGETHLVERALPSRWAGRPLDALLASPDGYRLVMVTRDGTPTFAVPGVVGQEGDLLHVLVQADGAGALALILAEGPA